MTSISSIWNTWRLTAKEHSWMLTVTPHTYKPIVDTRPIEVVTYRECPTLTTSNPILSTIQAKQKVYT